MLHCLIIENSPQVSPTILQKIFRLRHKVFCEQRQWVPESLNGLERDSYDDLQLVHVAVVNENEQVLGCLRMKPTDGPYMLRDIFPVLAAGTALPAQPDVWEISRFSIDDELIEYGANTSISLVTNVMLQAIFKYARQQNIHTLLGVTDLTFERLLRRAGLYTTRYSPPRRMGNCTAVAGYAEVNEALIQTLEERGMEIQQSSYSHLPAPVIRGLAA